jgi:hypothetical protein
MTGDDIAAAINAWQYQQERIRLMPTGKASSKMTTTCFENALQKTTKKSMPVKKQLLSSYRE